ncbi:EAL domain-containing protein [Neobacillus mesonae]|uniref:EAL domain-containing protein n=1 Tax=Neobacillus mesonae TaxID=1193713 RepID=UPI002040C592|nr:EAL domain-containing protein [Neobacillus mesonae]MCM3569336.1 EAL domain-containing protein [Neobacillus mesonae]
MELTYETMQLELELKRALEQEEFRLYYQPKVNLGTGKIEGMEALIRWEHPDKGLVPPIEFISFAEETGLIIPMGEWVLRTACSQTKKWLKAGLSPMVMSVNLSVRQLYQPNLVERVNQILKESELDPKYLELEITESMMMDQEHTLDILKGLKRLGVQISLDDFGTGYSSLHYLHEFPIDKIKIDQSFIRKCTANPENAAIVKSIITMARGLKMIVVAEGIETKDNLIFLQNHSCQLGQGYFFSMPLPAEELIPYFVQIEQIVPQEGISPKTYNEMLMQQALESTRQELHTIMKQQQGMTFKVIKEKERFIYTLCDGRLMQRMGLTSDQVIGKELKDFMPLEGVEEKTKYFHRAWEGEENVTYVGEFNGVYYITSLSPIRNGNQVEGIIGSCVDVTELKKVNEALTLSESKYRIITENMLELVVTLDAEGKILYISPSHEKVLGYSPKIYEGYLGSDLVHPEDIANLRTVYYSIIESKASCQIEYRYRHVRGEWITVEAQISPVFDEKGELEYLIVVGRNITKRKKDEELKQKSERLTAIHQMALSVAHEIRNPLTTIKGFVQLMKKGSETPFYIETVLNEVKRLEGIVSDFLLLAEPQNDPFKEVDVTVLIHQVLEKFHAKALLNNIKMIMRNDFEIPAIYCNESQIKQVFSHILQNALEALPNGGIVKVQLLGQDGHHIKIRFIDNGYGMSEERLKKIGELFYSTKEKGTGLGFMICQKIIQTHNGKMEIKSKVNKGTMVDVILPIGKGK